MTKQELRELDEYRHRVLLDDHRHRVLPHPGTPSIANKMPTSDNTSSQKLLCGSLSLSFSLPTSNPLLFLTMMLFSCVCRLVTAALPSQMWPLSPIQIPEQSKLVQIAKNKASSVTSKLGLIVEAMDGTAVANKRALEASRTHADNLKGLFWKTNDENTELYQKVSYAHRRLSECKYERDDQIARNRTLQNNIATLNTNITDINVSLSQSANEARQHLQRVTTLERNLTDAQNVNAHLTQNNAGLMQEVNELKRKVADQESTIKRMRTDVDGSYILHVNSASSDGEPGRHVSSSGSSDGIEDVVIYYTF